MFTMLPSTCFICGPPEGERTSVTDLVASSISRPVDGGARRNMAVQHGGSPLDDAHVDILS